MYTSFFLFVLSLAYVVAFECLTARPLQGSSASLRSYLLPFTRVYISSLKLKKNIFFNKGSFPQKNEKRDSMLIRVQIHVYKSTLCRYADVE